MRPVIGEEQPFFANLGVAQVEEFLREGQTDRIGELLEDLRADGLVIHVNPLQEFCQPEGDRFSRAPVETIQELLERVEYPIIVKEVGQGMGPESLKALLKLPLGAIEFAAYGGTNFAMVELMRSETQAMEFYQPVSYVGHEAAEMLDSVNNLLGTENDIRCRELIISGGVRDFLDGYYLVQKSKLTAVYGQASAFLRHARADYESLQSFIRHQVKGLQLASAYLTVKQ
jgi:isopentenyl-diphosphate delta-isomerase